MVVITIAIRGDAPFAVEITPKASKSKQWADGAAECAAQLGDFEIH